jgi:hypothetical protein
MLIMENPFTTLYNRFQHRHDQLRDQMVGAVALNPEPSTSWDVVKAVYPKEKWDTSGAVYGHLEKLVIDGRLEATEIPVQPRRNGLPETRRVYRLPAEPGAPTGV